MKQTKKNESVSVFESPCVLTAIHDAVKKALAVKPLVLHISKEKHPIYLIDGEAYEENGAIEKILGNYSWWKN